MDTHMPPRRVAFCTNQYDAEKTAAALNAAEQQSRAVEAATQALADYDAGRSTAIIFRALRAAVSGA
jgi:hypothetical protein